jgi:hypothetical protein
LKLINIGLGVDEEEVIEDDVVDEVREEQNAESTMEEVD